MRLSKKRLRQKAERRIRRQMVRFVTDEGPGYLVSGESLRHHIQRSLDEQWRRIGGRIDALICRSVVSHLLGHEDEAAP